MKNRLALACLSLSCIVAAASLLRITPVHGATAATTAHWNQQAAADYLDRREIWWQQWPRAQKDYGTICISCHTVVPYAMARPALHPALHETGPAAPEKILIDSVEKRVAHWSEMVPFYSDEKSGPGKTTESHATEAVLNAVILAAYDARQGHLRPITRTAFDAAWQLQLASGDNAGGWQWQDFHLGPWESSQSAYQGAALLLYEVGNAPGHYAADPSARPHIEQLREYIRRQYTAQPLMNQLYVLWASTKNSGLLTKDEREVLLTRLKESQQADGGWRLASLTDWKRVDSSAVPTESDGFATSLAVLVMEESGEGRRNPSLQRGLTWIEQNQQKEGNWAAASMNKQRDPASDVGRFMSDAATGYAVLALEKAH
jgi:squalene-hopene/tetraprenyl-beta-curcumene cyclase